MLCTGVLKMVCVAAIHPLSCDAAAQELVHQVGYEVEMQIDLDGSGPMVPFPVVCSYYSEYILSSFNGFVRFIVSSSSCCSKTKQNIFVFA